MRVRSSQGQWGLMQTLLLMCGSVMVVAISAADVDVEAAAMAARWSPVNTYSMSKLLGVELSTPDLLASGNQPIRKDMLSRLPGGDDTTRHELSSLGGKADGPASFLIQVAAAPAAVAVGQERSTAATSATSPGQTGSQTRASATAAAVASQVDAVTAAAKLTGKVVHRYTHAFSGFSVASLTPKQLAALEADPTVVGIWPNELHTPQTYTVPEFLHLTSHDKDAGKGHHDYVWDELGGVFGPDGAGEDVVIGFIDQGIWMEGHPGFADSSYATGTRDENHGAKAYPSSSSYDFYEPLSRWQGICQRGQDGTAFPCNNKVIGCRWYLSPDFGNDLLLDQSFDCFEPLGGIGHGSHVAATAAGNFGQSSLLAPPGAQLSGVAPRARIAVYRTCWLTQSSTVVALCDESDIIKAIDDAIQDGVDVLVYPLTSGQPQDTGNPFQTATLNAAAAGIFMSHSATNNGPGLGTVQSQEPWVTTVAASTIPRSVVGKVVLGNGHMLHGRSAPLQPLVQPLPLVYAANAVLTSTDTAECETGTLDPAVVRGRIVICDYNTAIFSQGPFAFEFFVISKKAAEVVRAGGVGLIVAVQPGGPVEHFLQDADIGLPYYVLAPAEGQAAITYATTAANPTAAFEPSKFAFDKDKAPQMASFSARGPARAILDLVLKPDITAPGAAIHAAVRPTNSTGQQLYNTQSGTSVAAAVIGGVAALIKDEHPSWGPSAIKSAIMTSAYQAQHPTGKPFGSALDFGAGHIDPPSALNPGLVLTTTEEEWKTWQCKAQTALIAVAGGGVYTRPPWCPQRVPGFSNLYVDALAPGCVRAVDTNTPSISGLFAGAIKVQRTLTGVFGNTHYGPVHFESFAGADPSGPGFDIKLEPSHFELSDGEDATVDITIAPRPDTPLDALLTGQVVWFSKEGGYRVAIPVAVSFTSGLDVPPRSRDYLPLYPVLEGSTTFDYKISSSVPQTVKVVASVTPDTILQGRAVLGGPNAAFSIKFPEGTRYARVATYSSDYPAGTNIDVLLYTAYANGTRGDLLANETNPTSTTRFDDDRLSTEDMFFDLELVAVSLVGGATSIDVFLHVTTVADDGSSVVPGALTVSPDTVELSPTDPCCCQLSATLTTSARGSPVPTRWYGSIDYLNAATGDVLAQTRIDQLEFAGDTS